ncbi:hypothetical protein J6590_100114, partial [Homalodisca vitripennis]
RGHHKTRPASEARNTTKAPPSTTAITHHGNTTPHNSREMIYSKYLQWGKCPLLLSMLLPYPLLLQLLDLNLRMEERRDNSPFQ